MSETKHPSESFTAKELYALASPMLDHAARAACLHCQHLSTPNDVARFSQRLSVLLLEGDYRRLRTYDQQAELRTWLQMVANREVSRVLKRERRYVALEDAPPRTFDLMPEQEENLLHKEREHLAAKALTELTPHEQKLIELEAQGWKTKEIARELDIGVKTVYSKKSKAKRKLKELVEERQKIISKKE